LRVFLEKISKFETQLGTINARDNRFRGFPGRMQWKMMFKEDAKKLRLTLGAHINMINLLLAVDSISTAEEDR